MLTHKPPGKSFHPSQAWLDTVTSVSLYSIATLQKATGPCLCLLLFKYVILSSHQSQWIPLYKEASHLSWWHMPATPAPGKLREEDSKFKVRDVHWLIVSGWPGFVWNILSQRESNKKDARQTDRQKAEEEVLLLASALGQRTPTNSLQSLYSHSATF